MAIPVQNSISLRDDAGVTVCRLLQVSDKLLEVEGETGRKPGQRVEFQFELQGFHSTLYGEAVVDRVKDSEFGRGRCFLTIVEIERRRRSLFREWLYEMSQGGGTPRRPHAHLDSVISSTTSAGSKRLVDGERRLRALDRSRSRPGSNSVCSSNVSSFEVPRGGVGREALRDALASYDDGGEPGDSSEGRRTSLSSEGSQTSRSSEGSQTSRSSEGRRDSTSVGSKTPSDGSRSPGRKLRRVEVRIARTAKPPLVMVRYNDPRRYREHYWDNLRGDGLQVRCWDADLAVGAEVSLRLVLPGGGLVTCSGSVAAVMPTGLGLALVLDETDRTTLRQAAGRSREGGASVARSRDKRRS